MIDKEQIIKEAKEIHGNKYDYSKIENIKKCKFTINNNLSDTWRI